MEILGEQISIYVSLVLLAIVQGLSEFLPISSSGHLALGEMILGVGEGSLLEDVVLHAGTLVAVLVFYRADLIALVRGTFSGAGGVDDIGARRYVGLMILGNIPAAAIGLTLADPIEALFGSPWVVFAAMAATGGVLWTTRGRGGGTQVLDARKALLIGCAQAIAILPGASRSGWTIAVGLALGLRPVAAARFSFLLSIPAIAGALLLELTDIGEGTIPVPALMAGFVVAALVGLFALRWLVALVRQMELFRFSYYLWALTLVGAGFLLLR